MTQTSKIPWCISRQLWWGHNIPAYKVIDLEQGHNKVRFYKDFAFFSTIIGVHVCAVCSVMIYSL